MGVRASGVTASLPLQIVFPFWRNRVSVVDQRVWLAAGRVRRLLVRVLLVLGGAFAVTVLGWLLCAGSANADELPTVPSVPSVVGGVDDAVTQVSTPDLKPAALPSNPLRGDALSGAALPDSGLADTGLADADLGKVTRQVHLAVSGVGDKVTPAVRPAADLVAAVTPVVHAQPVEAVAEPVTPQAAAVPVPPRVTVVSVPHKHTAGPPIQLPAPVRSTPASSGAMPHTPMLPPLQPAGSSDSNAHGTGGVAGGSPGAQSSFTHVIGSGLNLAGTPGTPRVAVAPGQQPGTSPD